MTQNALTLHTVCGLEELTGHGGRGVTHVLSLLDPGTPEPKTFADWQSHRHTTLRFHDCLGPGEGLVPPEPADIAAILDFGASLAEDGEGDEDKGGHLLVHCHYGLSRSTAALAILFAQGDPESPADDVIARLHGLREPAWPNARMIGFADAMLGRGGTLSEAVRRLHALQLTVRPHLGELLRGLGRGAEVDAALRG